MLRNTFFKAGRIAISALVLVGLCFVVVAGAGAADNMSIESPDVATAGEATDISVAGPSIDSETIIAWDTTGDGSTDATLGPNISAIFDHGSTRITATNPETGESASEIISALDTSAGDDDGNGDGNSDGNDSAGDDQGNSDDGNGDGNSDGNDSAGDEIVDSIEDELGDLIIRESRYQDGSFQLVVEWTGHAPETLIMTELIQLDGSGSQDISMQQHRLIPGTTTELTIGAQRSGGTAAIILSTQQSISNGEALVIQDGEPSEPREPVPFMLAIGAIVAASGGVGLVGFSLIWRKLNDKDEGRRRTI